jgi:RNA polymerase sigma-70 factor, ECF subfamily
MVAEILNWFPIEYSDILGFSVSCTAQARSEEMALAGELKKVVGKGVFGRAARVSETAMGAASLTFSDQTHSENLRVAKGLKRHDPELIDQLIVQYQHRLLRYLLYLTGDREMAEDLFQETWMRVLMRGAQFNGNSRFDTWLFTIARNLVIDLRRKKTASSLEALCEGGEDDRPFEVPAEGPSPLDLYESRENGQRVAEALLSLEPLHREVLVLRFHEELSLEEIAEVTRAPLSTVKSRLYRGLAALRPRVLAITERPLAAQGGEEAR